MSENGESGGGGGGIKTFLVILVAIVAGFWAIKLTFWLVKTLLFLAVAGAVGYVGYRVVKGYLGSDEDAESKPKQLTSESPGGEARARRRSARGAAGGGDGDNPMAEIDDVLRELEELKRDRGE